MLDVKMVTSKNNALQINEFEQKVIVLFFNSIVLSMFNTIFGRLFTLGGEGPKKNNNEKHSFYTKTHCAGRKDGRICRL